MKISDLMDEVKIEIEEEKKEMAKGVLKQRLYEIQSAKKCLTKLEKQLQDLLDKDIDDVV